MSLREALSKRRSIRTFGKRELSEMEIKEILWAGQGKTSDKGFRTAPSAGATYPLEVHVLTARGVFRYVPSSNTVVQLSGEALNSDLAGAALGQSCVRNAAANFVIGGVISRTAGRYGERAERYVNFEVGAAGQNMMLMATALDLGSVVVGAYDDDRVREIAMLPKESIPLAIVSVGSLPSTVLSRLKRRIRFLP